MFYSVLSAIAGAAITGLVLWAKYLLMGKKDAEATTALATDRLDTVDKQNEVDRTKRMDDLNVEAKNVIATGDAAAALELLRRQFPTKRNAN